CEWARDVLVEEARHARCLVDNLIGVIKTADCIASPVENIGGFELTRSFMIQLRSERATAQLRFSVGESYPLWKASLICDDGAIAVDYVANRVTTEETHRWLPPFNYLHNGLSHAGSVAVQDARNISNYVLTTLGLQSRADPFFVSMRESIRAFYRSLSSETAVINNQQSTRLVKLCCELAEHADPRTNIVKTLKSRKSGRPDRSDVGVSGGTGCVGPHV